MGPWVPSSVPFHCWSAFRALVTYSLVTFAARAETAFRHVSQEFGGYRDGQKDIVFQGNKFCVMYP